MQYYLYKEGQYKTITDADTGLKGRTGQRGHQFVEDAEITSTGFNGTINVDWVNIHTVTGTCRTGGKIRESAINRDYVVDIELTATGFSGTMNTDWINVASGLAYSISSVIRHLYILPWVWNI